MKSFSNSHYTHKNRALYMNCQKIWEFEEQKKTIRDGFKKKKLMGFSIKLAGWVHDAPIFH